MSSHTSSIGKGIGKFLGAIVISAICLILDTMIVSKISHGANPFGSHLWMTGSVASFMGMVIGITSTYAPNPLDHPEEASSQFTNMFEWVGLIMFLAEQEYSFWLKQNNLISNQSLRLE